jgi:hypothetical protein
VKALLALYDPSEPSADGSFWSWRAPDLPRKLLDRFYYDVAAACRPDSTILARAIVAGGFARLNQEWSCAFRFGDGGRDAHGRGGRFLLLAAFVESRDAHADLSAVLQSTSFASLLATARSAHPVPEPPTLELQVPMSMGLPDPALLHRFDRDGILRFHGPGAIADAGAVCAQLNGDCLWTCRVHSDPLVTSAELQRQEIAATGQSSADGLEDANLHATSGDATGIKRTATAIRLRTSFFCAVLTLCIIVASFIKRAPENRPAANQSFLRLPPATTKATDHSTAKETGHRHTARER